MALMIPATLPEGTPDSERRIFRLLENDPSTDRWVVFHSISVPIPRRRRREIDFLVLIPDLGILSLEVKGGSFEVRQGEWYRADSGYQRIQSPLVQARQAMFGLKNQITEWRPHWLRGELPLDYVVILTDANVRTDVRDSGEWIIGERDLRAGGSTSLSQLLFDIGAQVREAIIPNGLRLSEDIIQEILDWMGVTEKLYVVARPTPNRGVERRIIRLTQRQYAALEITNSKHRALITGGAGTGKTILALELARQRIAAGDNVALVSYNKILGDFLHDESTRFRKPSDLIGGVWYDFLYGIIREDPSMYDAFYQAMSAARNNDQRYNEIAPEHLTTTLKMRDKKFDYLIVDELQDMCADPYLSIFDLAVKGGLSSGRWAMFADFGQFTPDRVPDSKRDNLEIFCDDYAKHELTANVRSTRHIITLANKVKGYTPPNETDAPVGGGPLPVYRYWANSDELRSLLNDQVRGLISEGEKVQDIVVLRPDGISQAEQYASDQELLPYKYGDYQLFDCPGINFPPRNYCDQRLCCRIADHDDKYLKYRSVRRFKGMESKVVILIVDDTRLEWDITSLYVGLTRARVRLIVLGHNSTERDLSSWRGTT